MTLDGHHLGLYLGILAVASIGAIAYHERTLDYAEVKAKADAQEQIIATANQRMVERDAEYKMQIAQIMAMKSTPATTPQQIVERIPQYFPQLQPALQQPINPQTGQPDTTKPAQLVFDAPQAKLLNDTLVDCRICQTDRTKLTGDLADTKIKLDGMTKEASTYKTAAKGGSIWQRSGRIAKWLLIGAGIGYVAAKH